MVRKIEFTLNYNFFCPIIGSKFINCSHAYLRYVMNIIAILVTLSHILFCNGKLGVTADLEQADLELRGYGTPVDFRDVYLGICDIFIHLEIHRNSRFF